MSWSVDQLVPWYLEVADGWKVQRAKSVLRKEKVLNKDRLEAQILSLTLRGVVENDPENPEGLVPADYGTYQIFEKDDLVFKLIDLDNVRTSRVGHVHRRGIMSSAYMRLRPSASVDTRFIYWQFFDLYNREVFNQLGSGVRSTLNADDILNLPMLVPPLSHQKAIANFLDRETIRIDSLIEKKRRMVDLVDEKMVSTCETLLNSDGSAPVRLKHFVMKVGSGSTPRGGSDVYVDSGVAFLRSQNIKDGQINHDDVVYITDKDDEILRRTRIQAGDVLLNITGGSIGRTAIAKSHDLPANVSQHVCVIRPNTSVSSDLLQAALDSSNVQEQIDLMQVGGNREGLNFEQIRNLMIVIPNPQNALRIEQSLIVERLRLKRVKELLLMQIDLLVIRRQALTIAAVTGELEIPEVAA